MALDVITPVILTFNEELNIGRTLRQLQWANRIVVVDSYSTDATVAICKEFPNVDVSQRAFDSHALQWNYAVSLSRTSWVLTLDADYYVSEDLAEEISEVDLGSTITAYAIGFRYLVFGRPLRATILPPRRALFDRRVCRYFDDGHTQRLHCDGRSGRLNSKIDHDDRKPLDRWMSAQVRYARLEAGKLISTASTSLPLADRIRKSRWIAPWLVPAIVLIRLGVFRDGWRGWYYALQRGIAESILSLLLIEGHIGNRNESGSDE